MGAIDMKSALRGGLILPLVLSFVVVVGLLFSQCTVPSAKADNLYASIRGRVLDQAGAVVPDAKITATNVATGIAYKDVTDKEGNYNFLQVAIGDYKVSAEKQGFRTFVATGIHVDLNQVYQLEVHLEVGTISQEVMVEANPVQVETTQTQLGVTIEGSTIVNMPLIGRNWVNLQQLEPGVVAASDGRGDFATNGSQSQQNSYLIDGTDTNDLPLNTPLVITSPDAIAEFRMVTGSINPEYGRNSGAVINAVTKSGSNSFHGDAFEFYRDPFLNAQNFFTHKRQQFHQHLFGGTIGGPVIKNHTFWFFSYQGIRNRQPELSNGAGVTTVFDASVFDPTNPSAGAIYGPSATHPQGSSIATRSTASPISLTGSDGKVYPAGTPYSTIFGCVGAPAGCVVGFIPGVDINSISSKLLKFVPKPNGTLGGALRQFNFAPTITGLADQYVGRIDQTFSSKDSLWGTFFIQRNPSHEDLPFTGATVPGFGDSSLRHYKEFTVSWSHVFNANIVNEMRGGYNRFNFVAVTPTVPADPAAFGFNIKPQFGGASAGLPVVGVRGLFTLGFSANGPQPRKDQTYEGVDNLSITSGRHSLKFGFDTRRFHVDNPFAGNNDGNFTFHHNGIFSTGNAGADFLLGIPDNYLQGSGGIIDAIAQEYYSYAQDQYKLRPNLTITYGLGWQIDTPLFDKSYGGHAQFAFVPGQQSIIFPNSPVGYVFQGDPGVHAAGTAHYFKNFGPRLGFAYSPGWGGKLTGGAGKTSIRAGAGIYYNRYEEEQTLQFLGGAPFGFNSVGAGQTTFADPFTNIQTRASVTQPFPYPGPSKNITFGQFFPLYNSNAGMDPNITDPMAINYNVTLERQLSPSTLFSVGYVGSVAHRLTTVVPQNLVTNVAPCAADPACGPFNMEYTHPESYKYPQAAPCAFNNFDPAAPCSIYGPIVTIGTAGNSNYNALQASVKHRLSHGLDFLVSYTFSHTLDEASGFENSAFGGGNFGGFGSLRGTNPYNPRLDYGNAIFDAKQRLVIGYYYQIPSIRHFQSMAWMPSRVTEGWTFGGITTFQTGFPLDVVDGNLTSLLSSQFDISDNTSIDVPSLTGKITYFNPRNNNNSQMENACAAGGQAAGPVTGRFWFSPGAFTCETTPGVLGNAGRNILRGPGINNFDFELYKDTRITEGTKLELRIEFYNVMNHPNFDPNSVITDMSDSRFGQITNVRPSNPTRLIQLAAKFYF
jgi:Carboxypeptidase regulatory-like domain